MALSVFRRRGITLAAMAAVGVTVLAACGSSGSSGGGSGGGSTSTTAGQYGTLPAASSHKLTGGTITFPIENGSQPTYIMPITPGNDTTAYNAEFLQYLLYRPLYWTPVGNRPIVNTDLSLAALPVYSNGNKTITINMKQTYKWSNGAPVDAQDVLFFIDELRAAVKENPANFGNYSPGSFPDNVVTATAPSQYQVVLKLDKAYNPSWYTDTQLNLISPLPSTDWNIAQTGGPHLSFANAANAKKIYDYLDAQSKKLGSYASDPLWQDVDGPFKLSAFNPTTDAPTFVPNPTYGGPQKPVFTKLVGQYFASTQAEFNALKSGALNLGDVHSQFVPQISQIKALGYNVYGYPDLGFSYILLNFEDTTNHWDKIVGQLYFRQVLAHLSDQAAIIHGGFHGAAAQAFGPVPAVPQTAFVPADATTNPYPYSTSAASQLLSSHGWHVVPNGTTTCQSAGTGANQCGAGIPKGQKISFSIPTTNDPPVSLQITDQLASAAKQVGISITPVAKTFNYLIENYDDVAHPENKNKWAAQNFGGFTTDIYPTTEDIFNTGGSFNSGGYKSAKADALIKASKFSSNPQALKNEASFITQDLPGIFGPNEDRIYAWKGISGPPDSFSNLSQFAFTPEYWYLTSSK